MRSYTRDYDETRTRDYDRNEMRDRDRGGMFGWNNDRDSRENREYGSRQGWFDNDSRNSERDFGPDQHRRGIARDETRELIASDKVEGTPVYGRDREKLGSIHNFMVEKRGGTIEYAVMKTSSGFLGLDERYYPLQWNELEYDTRIGGYHVDMTKDDLEGRRSFDSRGRSNERGSHRRSYSRDRNYERSTW